jgi:hypothetical protein
VLPEQGMSIVGEHCSAQRRNVLPPLFNALLQKSFKGIYPAFAFGG